LTTVERSATKFACMANDGASYAETRPQLNGRLSSAAWSQKVSPLRRRGFPRGELYEIPFRWSTRDGYAETLDGLEIE
jgi:hypothetical protein